MTEWILLALFVVMVVWVLSIDRRVYRLEQSAKGRDLAHLQASLIDTNDSLIKFQRLVMDELRVLRKVGPK